MNQGSGVCMEWSLKPCTSCRITMSDRLTSLPDELLIRILSLLPTKDVAVTSSLSRRLRRVFPFITSLDFDVSPISLCLKHPYAVERFPTFVTFVDNVLFAYKSHHLSKFRLQVGIGFLTRHVNGCVNPGQPDELGCHQHCLPDLKPTHLHAWISFPLTLSGLRMLDLCILVRDPGENQLPPAIFMCQTLEVLRLEVNLGLDQVSTMPSYCLPKLKLLRLCASFVLNYNFLPRLVFSCPLLEDLTFIANTSCDHHATIHSLSLRKLCLILYRDLDRFSDSRVIANFQTPNIEYFEYTDNLALEYSSPIMPCLVEAKLCILETLKHEPLANSYLITLQLLRLVSCVQRLTLSEHFLQELDCDEVKAQLPLFPNLNHLTVDCAPENYFWDKILWAFLNCSPVLETLVFQMGLSDFFDEEDEKLIVCDVEQLNLERDFFRAAHAIPSCCRYHLKRIVICEYFGLKREVTIIQFLLSHSLVLEELVICRAQKEGGPRHPDPPNAHPSFPSQMPDQISVESALKNLPRASATCSIKVL
ncbi:hypothetical protein RDABS01_036694 [Bienertia sinuspersici]